MQHNHYVERDGHELVGEEEPGEAVYSFAYEGSILQATSMIMKICSAADSDCKTLLLSLSFTFNIQQLQLIPL